MRERKASALPARTPFSLGEESVDKGVGGFYFLQFYLSLSLHERGV